MPQQFEIGQGASALEMNLFTRLGAYGRVSGVGVTLGGSTTDIECNVEPGSVLHDGSLVAVSSQTVEIQDGDPQNPRKDVIWIDYEGNAKVRAGVAAEADPPGETREDTWSPAPPAGTAIDGVVLAEVWVPSGATSSGDLTGADVIDRRVDAINKGGLIRELASDPADSELIGTQLWRNTTANELRAYFSDTDEVHNIDTTLERSLSGPTEIVIEDFEDSIEANWRGGESSLTYDTPAFEGSAAGSWDESGASRDYSLPGDGLERYPEAGDTISMAFYGTASGHVYLGFGKETDSYDSEYRLRADTDGTLTLKRADTISGSGATLGSVSFSYSAGTWYIMEVDYDGGGSGVHQFRVYSTSGGSRDTVLAEELSPTSDSEYRGRGIAVGGADEFRVDRWAVTPS